MLLLLAACGWGPQAVTAEDSSEPVNWGTPPDGPHVQGGNLYCPLPSEEQLRALDPATLPAGPNPCREPQLARVVEAVDGDTVHITRIGDSGWESVRIIGVDTPETWGTTECYGQEAKDFTREALDDRLVWLTFDGDCEDNFDRTLAYVHLGADEGCFFERLLLRGGFADTMTFSATSTWAGTFHDDADWAEDQAVGLWEACM